MRPLPELTPANEWFWTSGADGTLRIQGCTDCGELVHPPVPICPYCRSRSSKPTRGVGPRHHRRVHRQRAPLAARLRAAVRHRQRRAGRGRQRPPHDEHRRLRAVRRRDRPGGRGPLRAARGRVAPSLRADGRSRPGRPGPRAGTTGSPRPAQRASASSTAPSSVASAARRFGRRLMVDPLSLAVDACLEAVADAGLDARRHRRPVDLSRAPAAGA